MNKKTIIIIIVAVALSVTFALELVREMNIVNNKTLARDRCMDNFFKMNPEYNYANDSTKWEVCADKVDKEYK